MVVPTPQVLVLPERSDTSAGAHFKRGREGGGGATCFASVRARELTLVGDRATFTTQPAAHALHALSLPLPPPPPPFTPTTSSHVAGMAANTRTPGLKPLPSSSVSAHSGSGRLGQCHRLAGMADAPSQESMRLRAADVWPPPSPPCTTTKVISSGSNRGCGWRSRFRCTPSPGTKRPRFGPIRGVRTRTFH